MSNAPSTDVDDNKHQHHGYHRSHAYGSLKELSADSGAIVVGSVTGQTTVKDVDGYVEFTLSTFHVESAPKSDGRAVPGATVIVRQTGGADTKETPPTPLLAVRASGRRTMMTPTRSLSRSRLTT